MLKKLKGFRTIFFNALFIVLPVIFAIDPAMINEAFSLTPQYLAYYTIFVSLANAYLRFITTTPVGKK